VRDLDDRPMPAGRLRERPSALARADLVLLTRTEAATEEELVALEARLGRERCFRVARRVAGWATLEGVPAAAPARAFLLAAVARPERFEADVTGCGVVVVGRAFFRDHYRFRTDDLASVAARARAAGAEAIVTTAKDAVRLDGSSVLEPAVVVMAIAADVADEARLRARLLSAAGRAA
jgi:tetraacyldisaccharide 4'-kinase